MVQPQDFPPINAHTARQRNRSFFVAILMTVLFVIASGAAIAAFIGQNEAQTNLDAKIAAANAVAVKEANEAKDAEFKEELKDPFESYTGPSTFGSLTFKYPKSWSVLVDSSSDKTPLDFYAHPDVIPGLKDTNFGLRVQIVDNTYDDELEGYERDAESGDVTIEAFRPQEVPEVLGAVIRGEIESKKTGILVLLPQRDKTFRFFTESLDYEKDFIKTVQSITFVP